MQKDTTKNGETALQHDSNEAISESGFRASFETITPARADEWLNKNKRNRPVRENRVGRYAEQMKRNRWMTSPDAIAFDKEGRLINGQHRLKAITRSGVAQEEVLVVRNLDPDAFKISDVGAKRTASDVLHIEGFKMPQELGATVKLVILWYEGRLEECNLYETVENHQIVDLAEKCTPRIYSSITRIRENKQFLSGRMPRSLLNFAHFAYEPKFGEKADAFTQKVLTGKEITDWTVEGETYPSPAKLLRDKLIKDRSSSVSRKKWLAWLIQSMNWYCLRSPGKRLRYREDTDRFPRPAVETIPEL
jgi:hypothetical protein